MIKYKSLNTLAAQAEEFICSLGIEDIKKSSIISVVCETDEIDFYSALKYFETLPKSLIYYSIPEKNFQVAAWEETLSFTFNSIAELSDFSSAYSRIKSNMLNNFQNKNIYPPLFFFTSKFPSEKSSKEWESFDRVKLFIPKILLLKQDANYYTVINFRPDKLTDKNSILDEIKVVYSELERINYEYILSPVSKRISLSEQNDYKIWKMQVNNILGRIEKKEFDKLVLSRRIDFDVKGELNCSDLAYILDKKYPECYNFIYKEKESIFFSASPEKLFILKDNEIFTEALAGSIERGSNDIEDKNLEIALIKSSKDIDEHTFVIDHLRNVLENYCINVQIDKSPSLRKLSNIQHLHTGLKGRIRNGKDILSIINDIFPTPAIGGYPVKSTYGVIDIIEKFDRGLFTGFIGWMNSEDDGEFIVAIRSGLFNNKKLYVYAGCGIVPGSDPQKEYEETQLKAEAIISLFTNENKSK